MASSILLFEDKLGITAGYESIWQNLLLKTRLHGATIHRRSTYKAFKDQLDLLIRKGNRNSPGFNPSPQTQAKLKGWVSQQINMTQPQLIIMMDPALFFLVNPDWDQATPDNLRGGNYPLAGRPCIIMLGLSAWHTKKSQKDIARLNDGFTDKEEWEEEQGGSEQDSQNQGAIWLEPVSVPYGKFVLEKDLEKVSRVLQREILKEVKKELQNG